MISRNQKLAIASRAKNQSFRRPVDRRFVGFKSYAMMTVLDQDGDIDEHPLSKEEYEAIVARDPFMN